MFFPFHIELNSVFTTAEQIGMKLNDNIFYTSEYVCFKLDNKLSDINNIWMNIIINDDCEVFTSIGYKSNNYINNQIDDNFVLTDFDYFLKTYPFMPPTNQLKIQDNNISFPKIILNADEFVYLFEWIKMFVI
jgi:hypothetical protein